MTRGEVYYLKADNAWGHEISAGRPVLILSSDEEIARAPVVVVASLTTSPKDYIPTSIKLRSTARESWLLCNQIRSVDKERLTNYMCTLSDAEMAEIDDVILRVLGLAMDVPVCSDDIGLKVEVEMYQRLYQKALSDLVEVSHKYNTLKLTTKQSLNSHYGYRDTGVEEPRFEVDTEALKMKMMGGEVAEPVGREENIPQTLHGVYHGKKIDRGLTPKEIDYFLIQAGLQPTSEMAQNASTFGKAKLSPNAKPVNVNTATKEDFMLLGMGEGVALNIIRHRKKHGKFSSFGEMLEVKGVGKGVFTVFSPMWRL